MTPSLLLAQSKIGEMHIDSLVRDCGDTIAAGLRQVIDLKVAL